MTDLRALLSPTWPDASSPSDAPVVLLLHGLGSDEHDLPSLTPWLPDGMAWASLRAPLDLEFGGATWFPLNLPFVPDEEPDEPEQAGIDAALTALVYPGLGHGVREEELDDVRAFLSAHLVPGATPPSL
ncbi:MAG: hypothetical protein JW722_08090 [Demequinaceae bacterium]|nr:hypothetical protein [Demequinaceae bacterium]